MIDVKNVGLESDKSRLSKVSCVYTAVRVVLIDVFFLRPPRSREKRLFCAFGDQEIKSAAAQRWKNRKKTFFFCKRKEKDEIIIPALKKLFSLSASLEDILKADNAIWPSPDGTKIVFATFDDTRVENATWTTFENEDEDANDLFSQIYPEVQTLKYPRAGGINPEVTLWLVDLEDLEDLRSLRLAPPKSFKFG